MTKKLLTEALIKVGAGILLMGLLLFGPAGTPAYGEGWLLMLLLFVPMVLAGFVMMKKCPDLLRKRLNMKEKLGDQAQVVLLSAAMFVSGFVLAGLGYRLKWLLFPRWISWTGCVLFVIAYILYAQVLRENHFLSRTIEVQEGQYVVDTGLYAHVRHPMYSATLLLFLSMPLILRSPAALAVFLAYPALIIRRLKSEEAFLMENLPGYAGYMHRVRFRLIPYIW